jgi:peroxiredoxin
MSAIKAGKTAPDFKLVGADRKTYSLKEALGKNLTVLAFYKDTCPTCQLAVPFIERIYQAYKDKGLTLWGIEQDDQARSSEFSQAYGLTFPVLVDQANYKVSYAYGIDTVPTLFLVDKSGEIFLTSVGFVKDELTQVSKKIAQKLGTQLVEVFRPEDNVPALKAG